MHFNKINGLNYRLFNEINGSGLFDSGLIGIFAETGGNFTSFSGEVDVLGDNTIAETFGEGNAIQGVGSSSSVGGFGFAIPGR